MVVSQWWLPPETEVFEQFFGKVVKMGSLTLRWWVLRVWECLWQVSVPSSLPAMCSPSVCLWPHGLVVEYHYLPCCGWISLLEIYPAVVEYHYLPCCGWISLLEIYPAVVEYHYLPCCGWILLLGIYPAVGFNIDDIHVCVCVGTMNFTVLPLPL